MPDIFAGLVRDWDRAEQAVESHLPHHHAAPETPATAPATMTAATAAAATTPQEEPPMSAATDIEEFYASAKADLAKVEAALPGVLDKAKKLEGNPLADLAVKAAESILPPEAVAIVNNVASKAFDELVALYAPAQATTAAQQDAPVADAGQAGAPAAPAQ